MLKFMLCSICNKNQAVIFINKQGEDGKQKMEGYCYECAKKQGINPMESLMKQANLSEKDLDDMTKQIETMMSDLTQNMDVDSLSEQMEDMDLEDLSEEKSPIQFGAIPLGSIFSGMFGNSNQEEGVEDASTSSNNTSGEKKKVKVKKEKDKRRKSLETFGTNLTQKAKNGQLDMVVGRDKEIQRMIQILNRRSKNNPCLIGEPGVGKTAIAQGLAIKIANRKSAC